MWKSIRLLTWLSLCNYLGFNEARFSKDSRKKSRLLTVAVAVLLLGGMLVFYAGMLTVAFIEMKMVHVIPTYLCAMISLLSFMFTVFRAGPELFSLKKYEMLCVLPVRPAAIVISRFLTVYLTDLLVSVGSTLSVIAVCLFMTELSPWFYVSMLIGSLFLPLLPMTAAMVVGTGIYAATASMRHKNVMQILFSLTFFFVYFFFMNRLSGATQDVVGTLAAGMDSFRKAYPPAHWFAQGVDGNFGSYLLFFTVSFAVFLAFAFAVGKCYRRICTGLTSHAARRNFVMKKQKGRSALAACFFRERKRYFSSSVYVMNTAIGYIMTLILVSLLVFGEMNVIFSQLPSSLLAKIAPFFVAVFANMSPSTVSAFSMEGKHFWLTQTLPVRIRDIVNAKLLVNLMFSVPCALISSALLALAIRPSVPDLFWLFFVSFLYAVFGGVLGLFVNMKLPMMHWDHEAQPVKQGKATLVAMFACFVTAILPAALMFVFTGIAAHIALALICVVLCILMRLMYRSLCALDLKKLAED